MATFDTHAEVEFLIGAGLEKRAAEAMVQSMQKSRDSDSNNLASKEQIITLEKDVALLGKDVENMTQNVATKTDLLEVEKRMDEKINSVYNKLDEKIYSSERRLMIMIGGATVAICGFVFSTLKYFIHV